MAFWIDALASRSGPLPGAATQFAANHGLECDPPRGVAGLCALRDLVSRAYDLTENEDDERRFIEGAGAYFALLLLDQLGSGAHASREGTHRLALGAHGVFDPFASIARVLEASDLRRALLAEVTLAEAEALGHGPVARVVREVERQLAEAGDARVVERWDDRLWVEMSGARVELDIAPIVRVTRGESDRTLQSAVRKLCAALSPQDAPEAAGVELPWEAARERIFPRLQGRAFIDALPGTQALHLLPLAREVWVTWVLRYEKRARYVRTDEIEAWSKDGANAMAQSLQNLARTHERARFSLHDTTDGPVIVAASRDGLDAARLLLPGVRELLTRELGAPCVVAVPHRDTLLAAQSSGAGIARLTAHARETALRAPHAITRSLLVVDERGVEGTLEDIAAEAAAAATAAAAAHL